MTTEVETSYETTYTGLIVRWLRGANAGSFGPLYISSRGKGTSLFMRGLELYHPFRKKKSMSDTRIAICQDGKVNILTINDSLGIATIAKRLGIPVIVNSPQDFRADGTVKNGVIQVKQDD